MKALVIGLGSIGSRHLNNLYKLGTTQLMAFRKRQLPPPQEILCPNLQVFTDLEQALDQRPGLIVVANPSSMHFPFARAALERSIPLYLEKPVAGRIEEAEELGRLSEKNQVPVLVGCQLRFHPNLLEIKKWLSENRLGKLYSASLDVGEWLPGWHPWEDYRESYAARADMGGGVVKTLIHEIDYAHWLFGPVTDVFAMGGQFTSLELDVEDTALISFRHKNGCALQLRMDYWRRPPKRTLNIVGEKGQIFWDYYEGVAKIVGHDGSVVVKSELPDGWERNDLFLAAMSNALNMAERKEPSLIPLSEGIAAQRLADAALRSMKALEVVHL